MKIGVIGAGRIGGNCAAQAVKGGHEVMISFARDRSKLEAMATGLGSLASVGDPREAARFADLVILSVPCGVIPDALEQAGALAGTIVVDTTNQFGRGPKPADGQTAASFNASRMPGARYTKSFNTLTSAFQAEAAERDGDQEVVQWITGDAVGAEKLGAQVREGMG